MKKFILFFLLMAAATMAHAQKAYFVYIQTEAPTPFFVKMGDKILASSSQGYLIIPSLRDSTYTFSIGMPRLGEKKFTVTINHKDRGFLLKDFSGSWALFDMQTMEMLYAAPEQKQPEPLAIRSDEFSRKLALAVDDPSLLFVFAKAEPVKHEPVLVKKEITAEPAINNNEVIQTSDVTNRPADANDSIVQTVASSSSDKEDKYADSLRVATMDVPEKEVKKTDTAALNLAVEANTEITTTIIPNPVNPAVPKPEEKPDSQAVSAKAVFQRSIVTRRSESSTTEGFGLVFLDTQDGVVDTIRILIPNPPVVYKTEADLRSESELASGTKELQKEVRTLQPVKDTVVTSTAKAVCTEVATESDFKKLRRDMVSKDNEEDMVDRARKIFRTKCFSTQQVKLLGALFLTPGGRYSFFDAAYGHVSDPSEFGSLRSELSNDEYYLKRFKALIGE